MNELMGRFPRSFFVKRGYWYIWFILLYTRPWGNYSLRGVPCSDLGSFFSCFLVKYYGDGQQWDTIDDKGDLTFLLNSFKSSALTPCESSFCRPNETSEYCPSGSRR